VSSGLKVGEQESREIPETFLSKDSKFEAERESENVEFIRTTKKGHRVKAGFQFNE